MSIRLIDTETLRLRLFTASLAPAYAILSHTWGENEEVSFQEFTQISETPDHKASRKSGYEKIVATCREAKANGMAYAWIDTCCIDKTSSAELGEAINSMFGWYRDAEVCYAFLSDWPAAGDDGESTDDALKDCRWFTRGWCLQELIAPRVLRFYDAKWNFRGHRSDFRAAISSITRVDADVLGDCTLLESKPVARRMSWASRRTTTRVEDIAYCLIGIFDVNMPMLYGEGDRAFLRLQEEIIRRSNDISIFCHAPLRPESTTRFKGEENMPQDLSDLHFCDMLAKSPEAFSESNSISRIRGTLLDGREFSMTNRGIRFGRRRFFEVPEINCLGMKLDYAASPNCKNPEIFNVFLRKVGPNLFSRVLPMAAKYRHTRVELNDARRTMLVEEDACVISRVTPSIQRQIQESVTRRVDVYLQILQNHEEHLKLQVVEGFPPDRWDSLNSKFLIPKGAPYRTSLRLRITLGQSHNDVYLTCGIPSTSGRDGRKQPWTAFSTSDCRQLWYSGNWGDDDESEMAQATAQYLTSNMKASVVARICQEPRNVWGSMPFTCKIEAYLTL
ncbi:sugar transporter [Colletotrichum limetticola]|uniref:Sugar transporter n=1 Tax=Colletotrichum limetticola TaxID=1209924 RepID=A0ABQ9Q1J7_9PEZI|nr:sugar transporter [Colletotrichum limetticola]